jgi:hypothetical protein
MLVRVNHPSLPVDLPYKCRAFAMPLLKAMPTSSACHAGHCHSFTTPLVLYSCTLQPYVVEHHSPCNPLPYSHMPLRRTLCHLGQPYIPTVVDST